MAGGDDLRGGGHAHGVGAGDPGKADLRRGLVLGTGEVHIDALFELDAQVGGRLPGQVLEGGGVKVGGVGEPGAELGQVLAPERGLHKDLDLVGDEHEVTGLEVQVDAVGDDEGVAAQQPQDPDGIGHLLVGVALVVVHAALHDGHLLAPEGAENQLALMAGGGGHLEVGDLPVGDTDGVLHHVAQEAQAGTQDHGHLGGKAADLAADVVRALLVLGKRVVHKACPPYL